MTDDLVRLGNALRRWIADGLDVSEADDVAPALLSLHAEAWSILAECFPDLVSVSNARAFINRGRSLVPVEPLKAVAVTYIATRMAEHVKPDLSDEADLLELHGDAWKEHAQALLEVGRYSEAESAVRSANLYYMAPGLEHKSAILGLVAGEILHALGHTHKALLMLEQQTNLLLLIFEDKKRYVQGRLIYAKLLIYEQRIAEALEVFVSIADAAEELKDKELQAIILNNAGICYGELGKLDKAKQCIQTALALLEQLGLKTDAVRSRFELIYLLRYEGRYKEAINQLYMNQNALLSLGQAVDAARVGLVIAELLPLDGRSADVPPLCIKMIDTFTKVGLHTKALEALGHLNSVAQERGCLSQDEIENVRTMLDLLSSISSSDDIVEM